MLEYPSLAEADVFYGLKIYDIGGAREERGGDLLDGAFVGDDEVVVFVDGGADPGDDEDDAKEGEDDNVDEMFGLAVDGEDGGGGDVGGEDEDEGEDEDGGGEAGDYPDEDEADLGAADGELYGFAFAKIYI